MKKRLVILGGGESGVGAALLAAARGYDVFLSDGGTLKPSLRAELQEQGIAFEEGGHSIEKIMNADEVVKSPGIGEKNPIVQQLRSKGTPIIGEIELAFRYKGDSKIVAITGSNGKTTTTSLIYHICRTAGLDAALVGNIGHSFARQVYSQPRELYVLEISSFQLDDISNFRPHIAVLLNITEDHLDRYDYQFSNYINSKFRIIENQTNEDYFIYCQDDEVIMQKIPFDHLHTYPQAFSMKQ